MAQFAEEKEMREKIETAMRLEKGGFQSSSIGFVFPGTDPAILKAAIENKQKLKEQPMLVKVAPPKPSIKIEPFDSEGKTSLSFNQDMVAPATIN